jgi:hypothetical protein
MEVNMYKWNINAVGCWKTILVNNIYSQVGSYCIINK